jgi:UDP-N-acetylmuramate: L-alanyl-gamma-D-glutamyl-meso-diaminopimelate ligase
MGISEEDFYEAISSFKGASKRLEKMYETSKNVLFKDFAHSPSKVKATTDSVKEQYTQKQLIACLELHTYSSLNAEFLKEYENALDSADVAIVYYSPDAVAIKRLETISENQIKSAFKREDLVVFTNPSDFKAYLFSLDFNNSTILMMSSGNYGNLDFEELKLKMRD